MIQEKICIKNNFKLGFSDGWKDCIISEEDRSNYVEFFKNKLKNNQIQLRDTILLLNGHDTKEVEVLSFIVFLKDVDLIVDYCQNPFYIHIFEEESFKKKIKTVFFDKFKVNQFNNEKIFNGFLIELSKLNCPLNELFVSSNMNYNTNLVSSLIPVLNEQQWSSIFSKNLIKKENDLNTILGNDRSEKLYGLLNLLLDNDLIEENLENLNKCLLLIRENKNAEESIILLNKLFNNKKLIKILQENWETVVVDFSLVKKVLDNQIIDENQIYKNKSLFLKENITTVLNLINLNIINLKDNESVINLSTLFENEFKKFSIQEQKVIEVFVKEHQKDLIKYNFDFLMFFKENLEFAVSLNNDLIKNTKSLNGWLKNECFEKIDFLLENKFLISEDSLLDVINNISNKKVSSFIDKKFIKSSCFDGDAPIEFLLINHKYKDINDLIPHLLTKKTKQEDDFISYCLKRKDKNTLISFLYSLDEPVNFGDLTSTNGNNWYHVLTSEKCFENMEMLSLFSQKDLNFYDNFFKKNSDGKTAFDLFFSHELKVSNKSCKFLINKKTIDYMLNNNLDIELNFILSDKEIAEEIRSYINLDKSVKESNKNKKIKV